MLKMLKMPKMPKNAKNAENAKDEKNAKNAKKMLKKLKILKKNMGSMRGEGRSAPVHGPGENGHVHLIILFSELVQ